MNLQKWFALGKQTCLHRQRLPPNFAPTPNLPFEAWDWKITGKLRKVSGVHISEQGIPDEGVGLVTPLKRRRRRRRRRIHASIAISKGRSSLYTHGPWPVSEFDDNSLQHTCTEKKQNKQKPSGFSWERFVLRF